MNKREKIYALWLKVMKLSMVLVMNSKHTYSAFHRFSVLFILALAIAFFIFGLFSLISLMNSSAQGKPILMQNYISSFLIFSVLLPLFHLYIIFMEVDIHVDESGVDLKSLIKTFHVNWEDVVEVRRASLFGIPMFNKSNIVITKSKLSPFHYLYGFIYGRVFQPSFFFSKFIHNSDGLRRTIMEGIKKGRLAKQHKAKKSL